MEKSIALAGLAAFMLVGCASVPLESAEKNTAAKKFSAPADGKAGLYIYRSGSFGGALKKNVWINGKCIGETAPNVFFHEEVPGGAEYKISTESEFSPNDLLVKADSGKNYFVQQYIKLGVFVGGAGLELVEEAEGKKVVETLQLASKGTCSQ